jgi:hypothetical protein
MDDHEARRMRGTGGNRFIAADSDRTMLAAAIARGLTELEDWGRDVGRAFDPGAITVETKRIANGLISVSVTGDLRNPEPPMDRPESPYANERVPHG